MAACNWPQFMFDAARTSSNSAAKAISPSNAANLVRKWQFSPDPSTQPGQPAPRFDATPVTYNGVVYVGVESGDFYAVQATTGKVVWKQFLRFIAEPLPTQHVFAQPVWANQQLVVATWLQGLLSYSLG